MAGLELYHTAYGEIRRPDVHFGRKKADLGQGFYTTPDADFAVRWARERKDARVCVNVYELELAGLTVLRLERDEAWLDYLFGSRTGRPDPHPEADVVIGPIANDTLYDTFGIFTSGLLAREDALRLLQLGPAYEQVVLKTERAAGQLHWRAGREPDAAELARVRVQMKAEEEAYQRAVAEAMEAL